VQEHPIQTQSLTSKSQQNLVLTHISPISPKIHHQPFFQPIHTKANIMATEAYAFSPYCGIICITCQRPIVFFSNGGYLKAIYDHERKCHNRKPPLADRVSICNNFMSELEIIATNLVNVKDSQGDIIPILGQYLNGMNSYSFCTICNHCVYNKSIHLAPHRMHCTEVIQGYSIRHWTKNNPKILCSPFDLGIQNIFCPQFWELVQSKSLLLHQNKRIRTDAVAVHSAHIVG
jgi:hypothetical protein